MTKKTEAAYDSTKKVIWQSIKDLSAEELIAELEGILDNAKRELKELNR